MSENTENLNYEVRCKDCHVEAVRTNLGFKCPDCKKEWWVDG